MKLPSTDQQDFADTVAALLDKRDPLAPMRHAVGPRTLDRGLWDELCAAGLLEPAEAGDVLTTCLVAEALGRRCAPLPHLSAVVARSLGAMASLPTYGLLDGAGLWSTTVAHDGARASGVLPYVPDADVAETVVVAVDGGLAEVRLADCAVLALETLDGTQPLFAVTLDAAPVTALPDVDVEDVRRLALAVHAATLTGLAGWLLDATVEYAGQRVQFGTAIAERQAVKHRCASMLIAVQSCRSMVWELADAIEEGAADVPLTAATTAAWVTDAAEKVAAGALQLHGGIGFTWEHDLHHYFKRCTTGALLLGSASHHRAVAAALLTPAT